MSTVAFAEVADRVFVLRHPRAEVNVTLCLGGEVAVVVDTLATDDEARQLLEAIRSITDLPLAIINTHDHFDHCFGNATVAEASPGCGIWAHEAAAAAIRDFGPQCQREVRARFHQTDPHFAHAVAAVDIRPPTRTVHTESVMDIGGRVLQLLHLGRGHTAGDLVVLVPDASVLIAGDLVGGTTPSFQDSFPLEWPQTLAALLHHIDERTVVVPGHAAPVDISVVRTAHAQLTELSWLIRDGHAAGATPDKVAAQAPFDEETAVAAVRRGYAELAGLDQ